jgi:hemoglobin
MQRVTRWSVLLGICTAVCVTAARGQDDKAAESMDRKALDKAIYANLKDVINHGANLYNTGDWNGCYRVYEGALMSLKPLLAHRKGLQEAIDTGITNAQQDPMLPRRAFVLRAVLDQIRSELQGKAPAKKDKGTAGGAATGKKTLWDRLGGEEGVTKIIDDLVNAAAPDPKVNFFRGGRYNPKPEEIVKMKREIVEQVSEATGGPLKYNGPSMKEVHKGMGITNEQFNALAGHLKKALEKNRVAPFDVDTILKAFEGYRKEIVEPKKPAEQKDAKKPAETKVNKPVGTASVSGKVTLKGKPLIGGTITLVSNEGKVEEKIAADGSYKVEGIKPGVYKVSIKGAGVPAAFGDPDKSGLTYTVIDGKQTHDIALQ